jgi:transposase-like protein
VTNARKPGRPRRHADSVSASVADEYMAGETITRICEKHNISRSTVYTLLRRHGITPERRTVIERDEVAEVLYDITAEQELIVDQMTAEADRLRSVLDRGD